MSNDRLRSEMWSPMSTFKAGRRCDKSGNDVNFEQCFRFNDVSLANSPNEDGNNLKFWQ